MKINGPMFTEAVAFGNQLLATEDLDPVYVAIAKAELPSVKLHRLLVAYWCLYHLGAAARIVDESHSDSTFWRLLKEAAVNEGLRWPRGSERRHWRGAAAIASADDLSNNWPSASDLVAYLNEKPTTFETVSQRIQTHVGFGPWIAFKVADMAERVLHMPVSFEDCALGFYSEPRKGAGLLLGKEDMASADEVSYVVDALLKWFGNDLAPPTYDRHINIQEVETILCKFKSMKNGHYHVGKDIKELHHALTGWGGTANRLRRSAPRELK